MLVIPQRFGGLIAAPIRRQAAGVFSCTMTAGGPFGATGTHGYLAGVEGSIDQEPVPGVTLSHLFRDTGGPSAGVTQGGFIGNATGLLADKFVWVDGVQYSTGFSGWTLSGSGNTIFSWTANQGPNFSSGNSYFIEIK